MDRASLIGIILVVLGILVGQVLEGGHLSSLVQPAAFVIVVVSTIGAVLLQSKMSTFIRGIKMLVWIAKTPVDKSKKTVQDALVWSVIARREGFLSLERYMNTANDDFVAKGLRLVIDGVDPERLKAILDVDISFYEMEQRQAIKIWDAAGGYAPT